MTNAADEFVKMLEAHGYQVIDQTPELMLIRAIEILNAYRDNTHRGMRFAMTQKLILDYEAWKQAVRK